MRVFSPRRKKNHPSQEKFASSAFSTSPSDKDDGRSSSWALIHFLYASMPPTSRSSFFHYFDTGNARKRRSDDKSGGDSEFRCFLLCFFNYSTYVLTFTLLSFLIILSYVISSKVLLNELLRDEREKREEFLEAIHASLHFLKLYENFLKRSFIAVLACLLSHPLRSDCEDGRTRRRESAIKRICIHELAD